MDPNVRLATSITVQTLDNSRELLVSASVIVKVSGEVVDMVHLVPPTRFACPENLTVTTLETCASSFARVAARILEDKLYANIASGDVHSLLDSVLKQPRPQGSQTA